MTQIHINYQIQTPIYEQISDQVKLMIEKNLLKPGERLPTIRELSADLRINPSTAARAYRILESEGILDAHCRRGTFIQKRAGKTHRLPLRQKRIVTRVNQFILSHLSIGYSPDELESALKTQLADFPVAANQPPSTAPSSQRSQEKLFNIVGSNDHALNLLVPRLKYKIPTLNCQVNSVGSTGGLLAILEGKADMAGVHLLDEATGEYNIPYIKHILQGIEVAVVHLSDRIQGFIVARGNPKNILTISDLSRPDITFVNRQKGSGTRVLLDCKLRELGILASNIKGYTQELATHFEVALTIANGKADAGLGIQSAASSCNLDFIPAATEQFDLVIPVDSYHTLLLEIVMEIINDVDFKRAVTEMGGYDTGRTGEMAIIK
jgi:molybdate-binding protein/DNA-binding transcriptional regulator YhcF (GntR family)